MADIQKEYRLVISEEMYREYISQPLGEMHTALMMLRETNVCAFGDTNDMEDFCKLMEEVIRARHDKLYTVLGYLRENPGAPSHAGEMVPVSGQVSEEVNHG